MQRVQCPLYVLARESVARPSYWCAFALPWMVKCQYYDILNTVGALFVVVLGGNDNEDDKSMQLRIIPQLEI